MFLPKYIYWELCDCCNLSCKHCFANSNPQKNYFADSELVWAKILEINNRQKVPIRFGGGEPLLHPGLFDLLKKGHQVGILMAITTNGTLLSDKTVERLSTYDLDSLTVSIDGTQEYHDYLRGIGNFARATLGLDRAMKLQLKVSVSFTITSFNYENILDYVAFFYQRGIRTFYFFRYIPNELGQKPSEFTLNKKQLLDVTVAIKKLEKMYPNARFYYEKKGICLSLSTRRTKIAIVNLPEVL